MTTLDLKTQIERSIMAFSQGNLRENGIRLLKSLGYSSDRQVTIEPNTFAGFVDIHPPLAKINKKKALVEDWLSVDILLQLTGDDLRQMTQGRLIFDKNRIDNQIIESYLFLAVELKPEDYSRTKLADITREVNKFFAMPVMILFKNGKLLTLSIIRRRLNKIDESKDVFEKVTMIKDIRLSKPHRAHIEILADLHLESLHNDFRVNNFIQLANAWDRRFGTYNLTEKFYREIANWYFATMQDPRINYPRSVITEEQRSMFLIRLLTRLIFCWFLQEKDLIPGDVFSYQKAAELLQDANLTSGTYYQAILQNLFFATLNQLQGERKFRSKATQSSGRDGNRSAFQFYRFEELFHNPQDLLILLKDIPFLNGGLFECLDTVYKKEENKSNIRFDDFSEEKENGLFIPNDIFFGKEHTVDLSKVYDDARKRREQTRGLIDILDSYKFTIEENTPLEEEIALDPELLGKVFENLLASYNEDTKTTARKSTGSFYTPREIVAYMVDETLLAYLEEQVPDVGEEDLRALLKHSDNERDLDLSNQQKEALIQAIENVRVLDPACGSGAFPMGMLQRLVTLLARLDPNNITFKKQRLVKAQRDLQRAEEMEDEAIRDAARADARSRIADIQHSFDDRYHELDFARKLYLIEDCIYGVDIQPVAVQIAKLRFFITLIVDQKTDRNAPNQGVRPLPNLETKLVAADSLLPLAHSAQLGFGDYAVDQLREQLRQVRHEYFRAKDPTRKAECRAKDAALRKQIAAELQKAGWPPASAEKLAGWDPYDPNIHADFFEPKWMFGGQTRSFRPYQSNILGSFQFVNEAQGQMEFSAASQSASDDWLFDIVLGNPPYVRQEQIKEYKPLLKPIYECYTGTADLYVYFYERGINLLRPGGAFAFITSNKWMRSSYGEGLRSWLAKNTSLSQLIDFGDESVFTALAYPCIVILKRIVEKKIDQGTSNFVTVLNWQPGWDTTQFDIVIKEKAFKLPQKDLNGSSWQIAGQAERGLLEKIKGSGTSLDQYAKERFYRGIVTGFNDAFIVDRSTRDRLISQHSSSNEVLKPFLRGRDIKRWVVEDHDLWLIFIPWHFPFQLDATIKSASVRAEQEFRNKYPAIYDHLAKYKQELQNRNKTETGVRYEWYALQRWGSNYWHEFNNQLIVWGNLAQKPQFSYAPPNRYICAPANFIVSTSNALLGILNSTVTQYFLSKSGALRQGGFIEYKPMYVSNLPIPAISHTQRVIIDQVVEIILKIARFGKEEITLLSQFEALLNGLVYSLYFPKEVDSANISLFDITAHTKLPNFASISEDEEISIIKQTYETLFLGDHPVRTALFNMRGLEFIRIIEEESNKNIEAGVDDETAED